MYIYSAKDDLALIFSLRAGILNVFLESFTVGTFTKTRLHSNSRQSTIIKSSIFGLSVVCDTRHRHHRQQRHHRHLHNFVIHKTAKILQMPATTILAEHSKTCALKCLTRLLWVGWIDKRLVLWLIARAQNGGPSAGTAGQSWPKADEEAATECRRIYWTMRAMQCDLTKILNMFKRVLDEV